MENEAKIFLKKGEEKRILQGHAWVYANEVLKIEGKPKNGSLVAVYSFQGQYIGKGYINYLSKILVRIFIRGNEEDSFALYEERILQANRLRAKLFQDKCYRMVFAEADNLPALIIDRYENVFVVQLLSLGIEKRKEYIIDILKKHFHPLTIFMRGDVSVRQKEGLSLENKLLYGELPKELIITECGVKMKIDIINGQKTGYFLDQKYNRFTLRQYCENATVLDCFCNSGGFSINAALIAKEVTSLDISQTAIEHVNYNAKLNHLTNINTVCCDVFEQLRKYRTEEKKFDCIVLDPPAFCKNLEQVKNAYKGYKDINTLAMKLVKKEGFLMTCSCSHYMTDVLFERMLKESAYQSGRQVKVLEKRIQSPDHPILFGSDESSYLKVFILQIL